MSLSIVCTAVVGENYAALIITNHHYTHLVHISIVDFVEFCYSSKYHTYMKN